MREILNVQLGQCGNNIGTKFWDIIANEHGLNSKTGVYEGESDLQLQRINVYFTSGSQGKYVPRSIMVDLDSSSLDHVMNSSIGALFQPDHFIGGRASASNNYAKGFYTDGAELVDQIMEVIRIEVENCDRLQGFQMFHGLGGGTGSGLGALVLSKIREEWPDRIISTMSIVPSPKSSEIVVEPYNCAFGWKSLSTTSDIALLFDNDALSRICRTKCLKEHATNSSMNYLIATTTSTITTCLRFPGQLNADLRKIAVNMIPFPELHFFVSSFSPLGKFDYIYKENNIKSIIKDLFRDNNMMFNTQSSCGKYITAGVIVRGRISTKELEETIASVQDKRTENFVDYIPSNIWNAICDINPGKLYVTAAALSNHTGIGSSLKELHNRYSIMLNKKAYLHWFTAEGMELGEFNECSESLLNVINIYQTTAESAFQSPEISKNLNSSTIKISNPLQNEKKENNEFFQSFKPLISNLSFQISEESDIADLGFIPY